MAWTKAWGRRPLLRRAELPRAARVEGRVALVVRRALPAPLHGLAAPRARDRDAAPHPGGGAAGRGGGASACSPTRTPCSPSACASRAAILFQGPRRLPLRRARAARRRRPGRPRWNTAKARATAAQGRRRRRAAGAAARPARRACSSSPTPPSGGERGEARTAETAAYEHYFDRLIPAAAEAAALRAVRGGGGPARRRSAAAGRATRLRDWLRLRRGTASPTCT